MSSQIPFTVLAIVEAKPGKEHDLKNTLVSLIEPTLHEEGCLKYDLHQCNDNPAKFMFYENWATQAAHTKHRQSPHMKAWRTKKDDLLVTPSDVTSWNLL